MTGKVVDGTGGSISRYARIIAAAPIGGFLYMVLGHPVTLAAGTACIVGKPVRRGRGGFSRVVLSFASGAQHTVDHDAPEVHSVRKATPHEIALYQEQTAANDDEMPEEVVSFLQFMFGKEETLEKVKQEIIKAEPGQIAQVQRGYEKVKRKLLGRV